VGDRDRDDAGRARNARPRDASGRPLARGGLGVPRAPEGRDLTPGQALAEADRLLAADLPFQAHEVFEDLWKQRRAANAPDTVLWQGLAQICVGLTHRQRGNRTGAVTLLRRGANNLAEFVDTRPAGVPVAQVVEWAGSLASALEAGTEDGPPRVPHLGA
jgi:hypothetical protein